MGSRVGPAVMRNFMPRTIADNAPNCKFQFSPNTIQPHHRVHKVRRERFCCAGGGGALWWGLMNINNNNAGIALASDEGFVAMASAASSQQPVILASGVLKDEQPSLPGEYQLDPVSFVVDKRGAMVTARITADDEGVLSIVDSSNREVLSVAGGVDARAT